MKLGTHHKSGIIQRAALGIVTAAIFAVALGAASPAQAQYYGRPRYYSQPYYPATYRTGLVVGLGVGVGTLTADGCGGDCGGGLSLEGHIGGMIDPRLALEFDAWAIFHRNGDVSTTTNGIYTGALQMWLTPILWIKGGLGVGNINVSNPEIGASGEASAFALMGAAGVEVVHSGFFALDLQGRLGHTFFSNADGGAVTNYAIMVGFNWY